MPKGKWARGIVPRNFHWIVKDQLAVCERPGGYGANHRRVRRQEEIIWIREQGFTCVVTLIPSPHNLHNYDEMGVTWRHLPFGVHDDPREVATALFPELAEMLAAGARLAERLLSFPQPTVIACNGNAIAMGAFTLLSADHRIGAAGDFRIGLNEVAIGMTIPWFGLAIARHRLQRPYYDRCSVTGVLLDPEEARTAGFLDAVVDAEDLAGARARDPDRALSDRHAGDAAPEP